MSLKIKNLYKNFGRKVIFNDFNYEFADNGVYALVGESGIGKTTFLRIISSLDKDFRGELVFSREALISVAFQEHRLLPTVNAINNVLISAFDTFTKADYEITKNLLKRLNFSESDMKLYPNEMSGGMKQRISLARALLFPHNILLLDEPTKELDEGLREAVYEIINEQAKCSLVILSSHSSEDIEKTNAICIHL